VKVVDTIRVGSRPVGVAVDGFDRVFVTNSGDDTVSVIDSRTNTVSATIPVGSRPESVATDPQFGVCVANAGAGTVSAIDRLNMVKGTIDVGGPPPIRDSSLSPLEMLSVATDHSMARAYVTYRIRNSISVINISGPQLIPFALEFIQVERPFGVAVDPTNHSVYVTQPDLNTVSVIDAATNDVVATIPVRQRPLGIAVDPRSRRVHVADSGFKTVSVIDISTGDVTEIEVSPGPIGVAVDFAGNAYVTQSDGTMTVVDARLDRVSASIPVGSQPRGVAFEPHSNRVYVANSGDGTVSVIEIAKTEGNM
jgi:YVTN family beta-propeller protein